VTLGFEPVLLCQNPQVVLRSSIDCTVMIVNVGASKLLSGACFLVLVVEQQHFH
jgi:hypothetical protein